MEAPDVISITTLILVTLFLRPQSAQPDDSLSRTTVLERFGQRDSFNQEFEFAK